MNKHPWLFPLLGDSVLSTSPVLDPGRKEVRRVSMTTIRRSSTGARRGGDGLPPHRDSSAGTTNVSIMQNPGWASPG
jgi:hypothetical protein